MRNLLFALSILTVACGTAQDKGTIAKDVGPTEFMNLKYTMEGAQLVDVRTPGEVEKGMIDGALHIDIHGDDYKTQIAKLDKGKPVLVYCAAGGRSSTAMGDLVELGHKEVYNLKGGYTAWVNTGLPTTK